MTQEELIHSCQHFGTLIENRSPIIYDNGDEYGFVNRVESQDLNHTIQISIEDISETVRLRGIFWYFIDIMIRFNNLNPLNQRILSNLPASSVWSA